MDMKGQLEGIFKFSTARRVDTPNSHVVQGSTGYAFKG